MVIDCVIVFQDHNMVICPIQNQENQKLFTHAAEEPARRKSCSTRAALLVRRPKAASGAGAALLVRRPTAASKAGLPHGEHRGSTHTLLRIPKASLRDQQCPLAPEGPTAIHN